MLKKIIAGGPTRKTRLHDEKGNLISIGRLLRNGPRAVSTGLARLVLDYRPAKPWISYDAISVLNQHLTPGSRVLEFGSGMSTIWYAARAGSVHSIDDYKPWYDKVKAGFEARGLKNVRYVFAGTPEEYCQFGLNEPQGFDLIMVDGADRDRCMETAVKVVRPGGIIYLDNSDMDSGPEGGSKRRADNLANAFAKERKATVTYFTDFAPTQLFVQQGLMVRLPAAS
jgi:hypothetical protein